MKSSVVCALLLVSIMAGNASRGETGPQTAPDMMPVQTTELPEEFFYATLSPEGVPELWFTHPDPTKVGPEFAAWWDALARFSVITRDRTSPLALAYIKAGAELPELKLPDYVTVENYGAGAGTPNGQKVRDYLRTEADRVVRECGLAELLYVPVSKAAYEEALAAFRTMQPLTPNDLFGYCPSSPTGIRVEENHPQFGWFKNRYENDPAFREAFSRAGQRFKTEQGRFSSIAEKNTYLHQILKEEDILPSN